MALTKAHTRMIEGDLVSVLDFGATGDGVTDDTAAIQAALNFASATGIVDTSNYTGSGITVYLPAGHYMISSTLNMPNATGIVGDGRWQTEIAAMAGFTGVMMQDTGNPSKGILQNFQLHARDEPGVTDLLNLGNVLYQNGTEGFIKGLMLRGGNSVTNAGTTGLKHSANVLTIEDVAVWFCEDGIIETASSTATMYSGLVILGATGTSLEVHRSIVTNIEIEAPAAGSTLISVLRQGHISGYILSQGPGITNTAAIDLDSLCEDFTLQGFQHQQGAGATLTNIIEDNRSLYPTNWGNDLGAIKSTSAALDNLFIGGNRISVKGYYFTNTMITLYNNAGTIQHKMTASASLANVGKWQDTINASTSSYVNTPTGADASTAFASGAKISTVSTNSLILDTGDTVNYADAIVHPPAIINNSTGTVLTVAVSLVSRDVNGTTITRPELMFRDGATGAGVAINTTNIPAGKALQVIISGYFAV